MFILLVEKHGSLLRAEVNGQSRFECGSSFDDFVRKGLTIIIVLKDEELSAVNSLLEGNDIIAILSTGFGKSVVFRVFVEANALLQREVSHHW